MINARPKALNLETGNLFHQQCSLSLGICGRLVLGPPSMLTFPTLEIENVFWIQRTEGTLFSQLLILLKDFSKITPMKLSLGKVRAARVCIS
jgi:hypothetical protein